MGLGGLWGEPYKDNILKTCVKPQARGSAVQPGCQLTFRGSRAGLTLFFFFFFHHFLFFSRKLPESSPREFSLEAPGPGERQREKNTVSRLCTGVPCMGDVQSYKPRGFGCCQPGSFWGWQHRASSPFAHHRPFTRRA